MKKYLNSFIAFVLFCCVVNSSWAQKFGYIDSEMIIQKMPEYAKAKQELNKASDKWQKDLEAMKSQLDDLKKKFQEQEVLLTEDMKKERLDTIKVREVAMREYQKKIYGFEGMYFMKKQELMKPLQDKIFESVEKVAKKQKLHFVFDKASELVIIYASPIHDYSDFVLDELGLGDKNDVPDNKKFNNNY